MSKNPIFWLDVQISKRSRIAKNDRKQTKKILARQNKVNFWNLKKKFNFGHSLSVSHYFPIFCSKKWNTFGAPRGKKRWKTDKVKRFFQKFFWNSSRLAFWLSENISFVEIAQAIAKIRGGGSILIKKSTTLGCVLHGKVSRFFENF